MSQSPSPEERRCPGRPRKWTTEAERARAYRLRKAEEHSNLDELRIERRDLKRQLSVADRGRARAEAALGRVTKRADELEVSLARAQARLRIAEGEVSRLQAKYAALATQPTPTVPAAPPEPRLSRQQRREVERNQRKGHR